MINFFFILKFWFMVFASDTSTYASGMMGRGLTTHLEEWRLHLMFEELGVVSFISNEDYIYFMTFVIDWFYVIVVSTIRFYAAIVIYFMTLWWLILCHYCYLFVIYFMLLLDWILCCHVWSKNMLWLLFKIVIFTLWKIAFFNRIL